MAPAVHWSEVSQSFDGSPGYASQYPSTHNANAPYSSPASLDLSPHFPFHAPHPLGAGERNHPLNGTGLRPAPLASPRAGIPNPTAFNIDRMNEEPGPWVPPSDASTHGPLFRTLGQSVVRPPPQFGGYRGPVLSNPESSHVTEGHGHNGGDGGGGGLNGSIHHDSGYGTNANHVPGTNSVHSGAIDPIDATLEDGGNFASGFDNIHLQQPGAPSMDPPPYAFMPEHPPLMGGYTEAHSEHNGPMNDFVCQRTECARIQFKTQSEFTKHQLRHQKVHRCDVPGCTRKDGFSTKNDLDRHKKSKHNIRPPNGNDRSYRCAGQNCPKRTKTWPRLDNFKAHCLRIHRTENQDELIKRSEIFQPCPSPPPMPDNGNARPALESPHPSRMDPQISHHTLLAGLSHPSQDTQYHDDRLAFSASNTPHRTQEIVVETAGPPRSKHISAHGRHTRSSRPVSMPDDHQAQPIVDLDSPTLLQPRTAAPIDDSLHVDGSRASTSFVLAQPPGAKKRKLSTGPALATSEQVEEASKSILEEIKKGGSSPESLQTTIAAKMQIFLDQAMQQVAGDADDVTDGGELASKQKRLKCRICHKTVDRKCDLKKHEKRHSRPWGCTNETCRRTFGSKNDWKRHENSQHHQLETWRCHERSKTSRIGECARLFFRRDPFQAHLRRDHGLTDEEYVRAQCRQRRVGRNFQNGFWCGFCRAIVKLHTHGLEAWDERFNHIDDCHFKLGHCIDDWYPMGRDVPKGHLLRAAEAERAAAAAAAGASRGGDGPGGSVAGGGGGAGGRASPSSAFDAESASESSEFDADDARRQRAARVRRIRGAGVAEPLDAVPPPDIPEEPAAAPSENFVCDSCGAWVDAESGFCGFCGRGQRGRR